MRRILSDVRGMTLIEIMVVITILGLIATVVTVNVLDRLDEAKVSTARTQIKSLEQALDQFRRDNGFYPSTEQGLQALVQKPDRAPVPAQYRPEGYLESRQLPRDPWGGEYVYLSPASDGSGFEIICYGADGQPGGDGEDADLSSLGM